MFFTLVDLFSLSTQSQFNALGTLFVSLFNIQVEL